MQQKSERERESEEVGEGEVDTSGWGGEMTGGGARERLETPRSMRRLDVRQLVRDALTAGACNVRLRRANG